MDIEKQKKYEKEHCVRITIRKKGKLRDITIDSSVDDLIKYRVLAAVIEALEFKKEPVLNGELIAARERMLRVKRSR